MIQNRICLLVAQAALLALALNPGSARATITVQDYWRMGENDPGASPGGVLSGTSVDSVGSRPLSFATGPFWESVSSSTAPCSSLCLYFSVDGVYSTNVALPSLTNNFGIELWVNPNDSFGSQCLVYTGDSGFNGWGIYMFGATYQGILGGQSYVGSATATPGVWTHLALVVNNGTATFYTNGVSAGSATNVPNPSVETLDVGINAPGGAHDQFFGYMDEMRFFTFAPGQFSPSDLLSNHVGLPALVSASASSITTSNAILHATLNPNGGSTTAWFVHGFDTSYGFSTPPTNLNCSSSVSLSNLISYSYLFTGSSYHYAVVASNSAGSFTSQDFTVTLPGVTNANVTSTADGGPGSLRQAILDAAAGGTINISATGAITLTNPLPAIFKALTINGPGANSLTINGNNLWRLFFVDAGSGTVNINNLTLANGRAKGGDGGMGSSGGGGGLGAGGALFANSGSVVLSNLVFSGNSAVGGTGGSWTNNGGGSAGGGGGLGGNGGSALYGCGGGGGFFGAGGSSLQNGGGGGGGGGFAGKGGAGYSSSGGGGGAVGDGQDAAAGGNGGTGGGGAGAPGNGGTAPANGSPGARFGGGGGGGEGTVGPNQYGGNGGLGGKFGGGGGAYGDLSGGFGGDFGGGGGAAGHYSDNAGIGGFGGGGGGEGLNGYPSYGGFGGGGGGGMAGPGDPGIFGGVGGAGDPTHSYGGGGGGGAALGGALFVRALNGASVRIYNSSIDTGSLTPGAGGASPMTGFGGTGPGQSAGSSIFAFGGTNTVTITAGTNTISGTIADYNATSLAKNGSGTLVLSAANSYLGSTLVNAGTLTVNGNNGPSSTYVASGATLAGSGTLNGVTLNPGATVAPGVNQLTSGYVAWSGAANYNWQLYDAAGTAGTGYGTLQINGSLDVSAASGFAINVWTLSSKSPPVNGNLINFPTLAGNSWTLVHTTGGVVGFNATNFVINSAPYNGTGGFSSSLSQVSFLLSVVGNDLRLAPVTQPFLSAQPPSGITSSNATLNAQVNPYNASTSVTFIWGFSNGYGSTNVVSIGAGGAAVSVTNLISNLFADTVYHYQIIAANSFGTVASGDQTFTTLTTVPLTVTLGASNITPSSATLNATVNPENLPTTWYFQYGTTTGYGAATPTNSLNPSLLAQPVSSLISGLSSGTLYHYRIVAANSAGTSFGSDATFTSTTPSAPGVQTQAASGATNNSATLNASVNPNGAATTMYFQYGLTTSYGSFTSTQAVPSIALNFNGVNQSASLLARLAGLSAGNAPHSIEAWLKPSLLPATREWALLLDSQHVGAHHWLINPDGTAQLGVYGGAQLNPILTSNAWVHLAACFDGTNYSVYTNGVLVGTVAASFNLQNFTLTIAKAYLGESYYSGAIDELRIWNIGRTAAQIQANMSTPLVGNENGLIAYYRMDEGTGSTLNDASGQGNTLQTANSPAWTTGCPLGGLANGQTYPSQTFLTGLTAGTVYHFRAVAVNSVGTTFGSDLTFTIAAAPSVQTQAATGMTTNSATLNASVNPNGAATTAYFQYGLTTSYGSFSSTQAVPSIALSFNGVNQSAYLPSPLSGLGSGNAPHTIEAWVKPTLLPSSREWLLLLDGQHAGAHHWLLNQDGSTQIGTYLGAQVYPVLSSNVWTHLAASFDGTNLTVYTNGVSAGTVATSFNLANFTLTLAQAYSGESYYSGGIYEVRIWNTARSGAQIQANISIPLVGNESGLIAYYRVDEGTGSTLNDASGHGNTLQTSNSPAWTAVSGLPSTQAYASPAFISGLAAGTLYHYRVVASNSVGITYGSDATFTTAAQVTSPFVLTAPLKLVNGSFQFDFTNTPGASFTVLAATSIYLPLANWTALTNVVENPAGHFRFTDLQATNSPQRFYRVRSQ